MNFSLYIAKRYLFTKSDNNAINFISLIAILGVVAGAFSLFVVLSGFAGLKEFSLAFTNDFDPDLKIVPKTGKRITIDEEKRREIENFTEVIHFSEVIEERTLLSFKDKNTPAYIKGVDSVFQSVNSIEKNVVIGRWINGSHQAVMGNSIARSLSIGINDATGVLDFLVPKPGKGQITSIDNAFRKRNATLSGIYSIGEELDKKFVFTEIEFARDLLNFEANEITGIELKVSPKIDDLDQLKSDLAAIFDDQVVVKDRIQLNDQLYKMLNTENLAVYLIFTLVLIIALFNVIGSIIMAILDKRNNIVTLYNLGATRFQLKLIFFLQGSLLTFLGGLLGLFLAILLIFSQIKWGWFMITPSLPYPVKFEISNVFIVIITLSLLGLLASLIAASRVTKVLKK
ncbi:MAG: ABC transporter permease [Bacteroidota bacterium]